jgi:DNA-binding MarR family transcriptional regulator
MPVLAIKFIVDGTAEVMMHPARFRILQYLRQAEGQQFVEQIAKAVNIHPRMVSHHIDVLQKEGLVESEYKLAKIEGSERGVAVRMCRATDKAGKVLQDIRESMEVKRE